MNQTDTIQKKKRLQQEKSFIDNQRGQTANTNSIPSSVDFSRCFTGTHVETSLYLVLCYQQWCFPHHRGLARAISYNIDDNLRWRLWVILRFAWAIKFYVICTIIDIIFESSSVLRRDAPFVCFIRMERKQSQTTKKTRCEVGRLIEIEYIPSITRIAS